MEELNYFEHSIGSGVHYITDNFKTFPDGTFQLGETSEPCILYEIHTILNVNSLPGLHELWSQAYPEDPMTEDDVFCVISSAIPFTLPFDPYSAVNIQAAVDDLRSIGCDRLAELLIKLLRDRGVEI